MKTSAMAIGLMLGMLVSITGWTQENDSKPAGAISSGATWCVFVNGPQNRFLAEIARLVDEGAEVQGGYVQHETTGNYSALVCKRGRKD
jgi:hypothetical protein